MINFQEKILTIDKSVLNMHAEVSRIGDRARAVRAQTERNFLFCDVVASSVAVLDSRSVRGHRLELARHLTTRDIVVTRSLVRYVLVKFG